ncbi:MAG: hypothetical protein JSV19_11355 [Phycisphaerales bacterium]|nr:MAG: hypothetical protein JSV19_11355 [Phycisphaerales bacterium]
MFATRLVPLVVTGIVMMAGEQAFPSRRSADAVAAATTLGGLVLGLVMAAVSDGAYHDDGVAHYLYARWAWEDPRYLLDAWARPGLTCLLFPAAGLGWVWCKLLIVVVSALAVWLSYLSARRLRLRLAAWVPLLCFVQPVFLVMSYDTLTESAMAFYLALAIWLHVSRRPVWGAAVLSLCFVTRYESVALALVWAVALVQARVRPVAYGLLLWAPLIHNVLAVIYTDLFPVTYFFESPQLVEYGAGTPLTMMTRTMAAYGPAVAALGLVGCLGRWRSSYGWVVPACMAVHLAVHSAVYWLGTHGSGGYPRFLVGVSPLVGIAAAGGLERLAHARPAARRTAVWTLALVVGVLWLGAELEGEPRDEAWIFLLETVRPVVRVTAVVVIALAVWWLTMPGEQRRSTRVPTPGRILAILAVASATIPLGFFVRPHGLGPSTRAIRASVQWAKDQGLEGRPVFATNVWAAYFLDRRDVLLPPGSTQPLDLAQPGTLFIWDAEYSPSERFGITLEAVTGWGGDWRLVRANPVGEQADSLVRVYERVGRHPPVPGGPSAEQRFGASGSGFDDTERESQASEDDV